MVDLTANLHRYQTLPNGEAIRSSAELLPWLFTHGPQLVVNKDSGLLACFEMEGADAEALLHDECNHLAERMASTWCQMDQSTPVVWMTVQRELQPATPPDTTLDPLLQRFEEALREGKSGQPSYVNRHSHSVLIQPTAQRNAWLDRFQAAWRETDSLWQATLRALRNTLLADRAFAYHAQELEQLSLRFEELLADYTARLAPLGLRRLTGTRLLGYLHGLASPLHAHQSRVADPEGIPLDTWLGDCVIYPHGKVMQLVGSRTRYAAALTVKAWPHKPNGTQPRILESLLSLPVEMTLSLCWRMDSRERTLSRLRNKLRYHEMRSKPLAAYLGDLVKDKQQKAIDAAEPQRQKADALVAASGVEAQIKAVEARQSVLGYANLSLIIYSDTPEDLEQQVALVENALRRQRLTPMRETLHLTSAFAGTLPGQWAEPVRWVELNADQVADLAPVHTIRRGELTNRYLSEQLGHKVPALAQFLTEHGSLFNFNFHVHDLAHTLVVGPSRGGKSVLINQLLLCWLRYGPVRAIRLDRDRSCRIGTLLTGGSWIDAGSPTTCINPLIHLDHPRHSLFLQTWLERLAGAFGYQVTADDAIELTQCLRILASLPPTQWRLLSLFNQLRRADLRAALAPWIEGGSYGQLFDHVTDDMALSDNLCIEMGGILKIERATEHFFELILYRIHDRLEQDPTQIKPTAIYMEEAGVMLKYPWFALEADSWLKRLAKLNTHLIMTVQSPENISDNETVRDSVRDNVPTKLYIPNHKIRTNVKLQRHYTECFELNARQLDQLANALQKRQYMVTQPNLSRLITTDLSLDALAYLRSDRLAQDVFDLHWQDGKAAPGWEERYLEAIRQTALPPDEDDDE